MRSQFMAHIYTILFSVFILTFTACSSNSQKTSKSAQTSEESSDQRDLSSLPISIGSEYTVVVVVDDEPKNAPHVKALKAAFGQPYPMLNQPEDWFNLRFIDVDDVGDLTKKNRYLILLGTRNEFGGVQRLAEKVFGEEKMTAMHQNPKQYYMVKEEHWARPQTIIYFSDENQRKLAENIRTHKDWLLKTFEEKEFARILYDLYQYRERKDLSMALKEKMNLKLRIPEVFEPAVLPQKDWSAIRQKIGISQFQWYFSNSRQAFSNVIIYTAPYSDSLWQKKDARIALRDSVGKYYIPTEDKGAYMSTETRYKDVEPQHELVKLNGNLAYRTTGFWKSEKGFQGGPFIHYAVKDEENNRVVFIDGFVAAKGKPKKKFIVRLKAILSTLQV